MDNPGISFGSRQEQNPGIIMLSMPAYGSTGPYRNFRAYGLHMEGVIGHTLLRGYPGMDPSNTTSVLVADAAAGTQGAFAVLAALHYRRRTGQGQLIELGQAENTIPYLGQFLLDYSMNGRTSPPMGHRPPHFLPACSPCPVDARRPPLHQPGDLETFPYGSQYIGLGIVAHVQTAARIMTGFLQDDFKKLSPRLTASHFIGDKDSHESVFQLKAAQSATNGRRMVKIGSQNEGNVRGPLQKDFRLLRAIHGAKHFIHVNLGHEIRCLNINIQSSAHDLEALQARNLPILLLPYS